METGAAGLLGVGLALAAAAGAGLLWFNRDPDRVPPEDACAILSPADGRVVIVERVPPRCAMSVDQDPAPPETSESAWRIAIFLSLWDVHVQRAPIAGRVLCSQAHSGGHLPALLTDSTRNAGHWLRLEGERGPALVLRSAGIVARRVTTSVSLHEKVAAGQRIGRILFGSRTELFLPEQAAVHVRPGNSVRAGETIIARWPEFMA